MFDQHSERFNKPDADVIFRSSDGVLFALHKRNLATLAEGFPPADGKVESDIIDLQEDSETLDLLFRFVYPKEDSPEISDIPLELLLKLSYAAEKYEVHIAIIPCKMRLLFSIRSFYSSAIPKRGVPDDKVIEEVKSVARFSITHSGYMKVFDEAAPLLAVALPLDSSMALFPADQQAIWALYREQWAVFQRSAYLLVSSHKSDCSKCKNGRIPDLKLDLTILAFRNTEFFKCVTKEECLNNAGSLWKHSITTQVWTDFGKIKPFSTFLNPSM